MTRINHILKELARNLYRNFGTAFASLLSLTLLFLLFDLYWIGAGTSDRFYSQLLSDLRMDLFISENYEESAITELQGRAGIVEGVLSVDYVSKEEARQELVRLVGTDLLVGYDTLNPLPRSLEVIFLDGYQTNEELARIEQQMLDLGGVDEVYYSKRWLNKAETAREIVRVAGLALGALILLTALISSTNNIRLMTRTRTAGFRQMRLLGAGRIFLAMPYLLEGFIISGLAAVIGWVSILYFSQHVSLEKVDIIYPIQDDIIIYCLIAAFLGLISGYVGIRKMLKRI